jgi:hypothetical protein
MPSTPDRRISRRSLTAAGVGFAAGLLAPSRGPAAARDATPGLATPIDAITPYGYVTVRMRPYETAEIRDDVTAIVIRDFIPAIAGIDGFEGYLVADVLGDPRLTFGVSVLRDRAAAARSDELALDFVTQSHIDEHVVIEETRRWTGDLLMLGTASAPAVATPMANHGAGAHVTTRIHQSRPNADPRGLVPEAIAGYLPIIEGSLGFLGYLWFPTEDGFVEVLLSESEAAAVATTDATAAWEAEHLAAYTEGEPEVINATVVYALMPILA